MVRYTPVNSLTNDTRRGQLKIENPKVWRILNHCYVSLQEWKRFEERFLRDLYSACPYLL